jgi:hypothetical protein
MGALGAPRVEGCLLKGRFVFVRECVWGGSS